MGFIFTLIALVGLLAALGYSGFLWQFDKVAQKRAGGELARQRIKKRMPLALGSSAAAALGLIITAASGTGGDIIGIILAGGAGVWSASQIGQANKQL